MRSIVPTFPGIRALYRNFSDLGNASIGDRLTAEATLAPDRFFLRRRATDRCVLPDRCGFPHLESLRAVPAALAPGRPKHFPLCVTALFEFSAEPRPATGASLRANRTLCRQAKQICAGVRKSNRLEGERRRLKVPPTWASRPPVERLKCVQFAQSELLSRCASAAFSPWLHVVASGAWRFFLLQPVRLFLARADFCLRQFSFFLAQVFSG